MERRSYVARLSATVGGLALAGCSTSDNGSPSAENQCDQSVLDDNYSNPVTWEGTTNETYSNTIESVDLTIQNYAEFPVLTRISLIFYQDSNDLLPLHQVSRTVEIEARGSRQLEVTDTRGTGAWDGSITELTCPGESLNKPDDANLLNLMVGTDRSFSTESHYAGFSFGWWNPPSKSREYKAELESPSGEVMSTSKSTSEMSFTLTFPDVWPKSYTGQEVSDAFSEYTYGLYLNSEMRIENSCSNARPGIYGQFRGCHHRLLV